MQRALDAGAVVGVERADAVVHVVDLLARDLVLAQDNFMLDEAGGRHAAQVEDDLEQVVAVIASSRPHGGHWKAGRPAGRPGRL